MTIDFPAIPDSSFVDTTVHVEFEAGTRSTPDGRAFGALTSTEQRTLVDSYRIFYRAKGDTVWVVGVWHDAQIPDGPSLPAGG